MCEDMADCSRSRPADPDAADSRTASPLTPKKKYQRSAAGHCFRRVTLTKPTFCHSCSDFIWGLLGFLCEGKTPVWWMNSCIMYKIKCFCLRWDSELLVSI